MVLKFLPFIFLSIYCFSFSGTISVLEAPLFQKADQYSKILSYYRKGKVIHIPNQVLNSEFLKVIAADGRSAYIFKRHVYLNDIDHNIQYSSGVDSTDYREENPLKEKWYSESPIYKNHFEFSINYPLALFRPFEFNGTIKKIEKSIPLSLSFHWFKHYYQNQKTYLAGLGIGIDQQKVDIQAGSNYTQSTQKLSIETKIGHEVFKTNHSSLNIFFGLNWHPLYSVKIEEAQSSAEFKSTPFSFQFDIAYYIPTLFSSWGLNLYSKTGFLIGELDNKNSSGFTSSKKAFEPQKKPEIKLGFAIARFF